jgi:hypothetical protein
VAMMSDDINECCEHLISKIFKCEFCKLIKRIEELEKLNQQCFDADPLRAICGKFEKLEERIANLEQHIGVSDKKPYTCPVCGGKKITDEIKERTKKLHDNNECKQLKPHSVWNMCMSCKGAFYVEYEDCKPCKGKGIVWG